jgi:ATP-dependent protease ClpP protease subunit
MTDDGDELAVIMGHPGLQAPGHVSLPEVMGTTHFMLCQA